MELQATPTDPFLHVLHFIEDNREDINVMLDGAKDEPSAVNIEIESVADKATFVDACIAKFRTDVSLTPMLRKVLMKKLTHEYLSRLFGGMKTENGQTKQKDIFLRINRQTEEVVESTSRMENLDRNWYRMTLHCVKRKNAMGEKRFQLCLRGDVTKTRYDEAMFTSLSQRYAKVVQGATTGTGMGMGMGMGMGTTTQL